MKRTPVKHEKIFNNPDFAENYAKEHWKMAEGFGYQIAKKISAKGIERARVIDVGCGFGATNLALARRFPAYQFVGIDLSDPLLHLADQSCLAQGFQDRVKFIKADVHHIPYDDGAFVIALNINMVHLVENPVRMLAEIERVLAPDGLLFIADLSRSWLGLVEKEIQSAFTVDEARQLFARSKLRSGTFSSGLIWWRYTRLD